MTTQGRPEKDVLQSRQHGVEVRGRRVHLVGLISFVHEATLVLKYHFCICIFFLGLKRALI